MAKLKKYHKEFIVTELACFTSSSRIIKKLKEYYGIDASTSQIAYYNPESMQGRRELATKWIHLFEKTRDDFIEGVIQIPIVHKMYRLQQLQKMLDQQREGGNYSECLKILEQAAKEVGGMYESIKGKASEKKTDNKMGFYEELNRKLANLN